MRNILTTLAGVAFVVILVAAPRPRGPEVVPEPAPTPEPVPAEPGDRMAAAAQAYVATLGNAERDRGTWELDAEQRFDWHFVPWERYGVRLRDMNPDQRIAAHYSSCN